ncbi:peroxidase-like [Eriocheir sinensis]|uniref:peroxidase-like n=1 Tax=Eriocheir sinensis TaxID=95602 RepID=UPI0021C75B56|nr:peroxidase-like [Eriocheir sinensis]
MSLPWKTPRNYKGFISMWMMWMMWMWNCGALVGPTFGCLIGRQFHHLRRGDRYWYEDDIPPSSFTKEQLYELCKTSLGRVICDSSDKLQHVQPKVMLEADSFLNAPMACQGKHIKGVDLKKWKTASPNFIIPDKMLQESIERARRDITNMRDSEVRRCRED